MLLVLAMLLLTSGCASGRADAARVWPPDLPPPEGELVILGDIVLDGFVFLPEDYAALGVVDVDTVAPSRAVLRWGEVARHGAVILRTNLSGSDSDLHGRMPQIDALLRWFSARDPAPPPSILISPPPPADEPVFVVDGLVMGLQRALAETGDRRIGLIYVARGERAAAPYGRRAWYGLVIVTTERM